MSSLHMFRVKLTDNLRAAQRVCSDHSSSLTLLFNPNYLQAKWPKHVLVSTNFTIDDYCVDSHPS